MGNPGEVEKTVINVKGVRKSSWEAAKRGSAQTGDSMGTFLSDVIDKHMRQEADAIQPPGLPPVKNVNNSGNPVDLPAVTDLLRVAVDAARLSGKPLPDHVRGLLHGLVNQQIRAARGMPAIPYRPKPPLHNPPTDLPTETGDK